MRHSTTTLAVFFMFAIFSGAPAAEPWHAGWDETSPREASRPDFSINPDGGPDGRGGLTITADSREGLQGAWVKKLYVTGGQPLRFTAWRKTRSVATPQRSAVVQITWMDDEGQLVREDGRIARPVYPADRQTTRAGWTRLSSTYHVPEDATRAEVRLQLRWAPGGAVEWAGMAMEPVDQVPSRKAVLAAAHLRPKAGDSPQSNRELFAPLIAEAAGKRADLIVLPEMLTYYQTGLTHDQTAEPVPGPSTEYFGKLAKRHDLYIVAGILEREGKVIYNTAVLLGPDGSLAGKYRKVCLPREEIEVGITPGQEYPVFDTRFGKLGIMICWDAQFPEVARRLTARGAEVIAVPIWGGVPALVKARAIENQVYVVTSTYDMITGVFAPDGNLLGQATEWGEVVVTEVDLEKHHDWEFVGDFKSRIFRERPAVED